MRTEVERKVEGDDSHHYAGGESPHLALHPGGRGIEVHRDDGAAPVGQLPAREAEDLHRPRDLHPRQGQRLPRLGGDELGHLLGAGAEPRGRCPPPPPDAYRWSGQPVEAGRRRRWPAPGRPGRHWPGRRDGGPPRSRGNAPPPAAPPRPTPHRSTDVRRASLAPNQPAPWGPALPLTTIEPTATLWQASGRPDAGRQPPLLPAPRHDAGGALAGAGRGAGDLPLGHPPLRRLGADRLPGRPAGGLAHRTKNLRPGDSPLGGDPPHLRRVLRRGVPLLHRHRPPALPGAGAHHLQRGRLRSLPDPGAGPGARPPGGGLAQLPRRPGGPLLAGPGGSGCRRGLHRPAQLQPRGRPGAPAARGLRPLLGHGPGQRGPGGGA